MKNFLKLKLLSMIMLSMMVSLFSTTETFANTEIEMSIQQDIKIKGIVKDVDGNTLPGVAVVEKGTTSGTVTNVEGEFVLHVSSKAAVVQFSFVAMVTQEHTVGETTTFDITMLDDAQAIDEVVVTGFQEISKERTAGSFSIVRQEDLALQHMPSGQDLLEGKVAGLNMYNGKMIIRGPSSFSGTSPLVVLDGFPMEESVNTILGRINPNDIKTFTVLKDASAASIYGSRASNGVIVITTKGAAKKGLEVDFSANFILDKIPDLEYMNYASASDVIDYELEFIQEYANYRYGGDVSKYLRDISSSNLTKVEEYLTAKVNNQITQAEYDANIAALRKNDYKKEYQDLMYRNPFKQEYTLSLKNGSDKNKTVLSLKYSSNDKLRKTDYSKFYGIDLKNTFILSDKVNLTAFIGGSVNKSNTGTSYNQGGNITSRPAYESILDENGNYVYQDIVTERVRPFEDREGYKSWDYNVLEDSKYGYNKSNVYNIKSYLDLNVKLAKWLSWNSKAQYSLGLRQSDKYLDERNFEARSYVNQFITEGDYDNLIYNVPEGGINYRNNSTSSAYILRSQLNFNKTFNDAHFLNVILGTQLREHVSTANSADYYGYDDQYLTTSPVNWEILKKGLQTPYWLSAWGQPHYSTDNLSEIKDRYASFFGNFAYSYDQRYNLTGSVRIDQSNLFGTDPKYRYRPMWSLGAAWNLHNEDFMSDNNLFQRLKLRASYGISGNVNKTTSPLLILAVNNSIANTAEFRTYIQTPPNPQLRWEKTTTYNLGLDFSMLKSRLNGSIDVYYKYSDDLLANYDYDPSTGFPSGTVNNGEMSNKGIDLNLSYDWFRNKNFGWTTNLIASYNKNNIEKVNTKTGSVWNYLKQPYSSYEEGTARGSVYAYTYKGINENGDVMIESPNGENTTQTYITDSKYLKVAGQFDPKTNGSLTNIFRYKGFELSSMFVFFAGHKLRADGYSAVNRLGDIGTYKNYINKRPVPGELNEGQMTVYYFKGFRNENGEYMQMSDISVKSADLIKLRNLSLRYKMPSKITNKLGCKSLYLRAQANNLWFWSAAPNGIDPESYSATSGARSSLMMPTYIFGIDVKL